MWDLATGARLHTLTGHKGRLRAVAVTGDGTRAVTVGYADGDRVGSGHRARGCTASPATRAGCAAVALTGDGTRAVTASEDGTAIMWDLATGDAAAHLHRPPGPQVEAVAVSGDGTRAVTGGWTDRDRVGPGHRDARCTPSPATRGGSARRRSLATAPERSPSAGGRRSCGTWPPAPGCTPSPAI